MKQIIKIYDYLFITVGLILDYHHPTIKLPKHYWAANIEQDDNMVITRTHVTILLM